MKVATFPESWRENPFLDLLETELIKLGVVFVKVGSDYLTMQWILRYRGRINVLHFHWLQYHYLRKSPIASWLALVKFCLKLLLARFCGYHIVWTMHNLQPHERPYRFLDKAGYFIFAHLSNSIVTLCRKASLLLAQTYGRKLNVFSSYLGNYFNLYPNHISPVDARERLGIPPGRTIFLFFGSLRPYKGIEELIDVFRSFADPNAGLIIAGKANDVNYRDKILSQIELDSRIWAMLDWIPDEDVSIYFNACDFVVLPFLDVMTSSSAMLALCFGKAVVAPAIGCLPEIVSTETGVLYDPTRPSSLAEVMRLCTKLDAIEMGKAPAKSARLFSWEELAKMTLQAYMA